MSECLDPSVAVIVDSSRSEFLLTSTTVFPALRHWGMPHQVVDLATKPVLSDVLARHGVILVAQEYLDDSLNKVRLADILRRVADNGAGLVNLDHALMTYPRDYLEVLGLVGRLSEVSVDELFIPDVPHPILSGRPPGATARLKQPLPGLRSANPSLDQSEGLSLLLGGKEERLLGSYNLGSGRVVQWFVSPKLWNPSYLGLAHGLDGLLWRSIVWVGPKPFCMNAMPPFVRFRFDDCHGYWQEPGDLGFVSELRKRGHTPSICFCLRALTSDGAAHLADLQQRGGVDLAPHTYAPDTSLFYGDAGGEYSSARFRDLFAELDEAQRRWGVRWSSILSDHEHEWSEKAIPYLRQRGIQYKMNITLPGERWNGKHVDWRPGPFGSMDFAMDHLPGELRDFFVVFNHHPSFESARAYLGHDTFLYHRPGGFGDQKWDFLNGLVEKSDTGRADLWAIADRLAAHTRLGLDSLFFGGSISHSHFTRRLALSDWRDLLDLTDRKLRFTETIPASYDHIARYAEARSATTAAAANVRDDRVLFRLEGRSSQELRLSVFRETDGGLLRTEQPVEPFEKSCEVAVPRNGEGR